MRAIFALLSAVLAVVSGPSYVSDIIHGRAKPQRATFFIFTLLSSIAFYGQLKLGAHWALVFTGLDVLGSLGVFLLAVKYGTSGFALHDRIALVVASTGLVLSFVAHSPLLAIGGVLIADVSAIALTLHKTYKDPDSEPYVSWFLFGFGAIFSALSVEHYTFALLLYPTYIALSVFAIPLAKYLGTRAIAVSANR